MDHPGDLDGGFQGRSASTARPVAPGMENNAWDSYDTVFLNAKAGMDSVDKKKVQKVVYDMSKGSKYFNNEQRKEAEVLEQIQCMNARAASLTPVELAEHEKATDLKIVVLEASRDLSHVWVHVDMDAFYAAVETLVNPSLAGKPMAVGGMSMICTANYEARKFGVRAAMPGFIARKLCPNLIFVRPDFKKYAHYSDVSRQVFKEYDPDFVARSMDEAYLDISKSCQFRNMSGAEVAEDLRKKVHSATGLTCSAGVGPNRLLAKVCSDINKPNGQFVVGNGREAVMAFISSLPIRKVNGIGKVKERLLKEVLGINTCADLLTKRAYISALFSQISTDFFLAVGLGIGGSETPQKEPRKSLSNERTFAAISEEHQLFQKLGELVELLADDMQKEDLQGRTLTLKLKETGFEVRSRAITLPSFISTKSEIWEHASKLLKGELPLSLRLMGLRMSNFKDENSNLTQRTLMSFITRSSGESDQTTRASHGLHNVSVSSSSIAHEVPLEAFIDDKEHYSGGGSDEKSAHEFSCGKNGSSGSEMLQTVIPNSSPQKVPSESQQVLRNLVFPDTPPNIKTNATVKSPGSVQAKLEDLIARRQRENFKDSYTPRTALKGINAQAGMGLNLRMDMNLKEEVQLRSRSDGQLHSPSGEVNVCQVSPYEQPSEGRSSMKRKETVEEVLDPSSREEDTHVPSGHFSQIVAAGFDQDVGQSGDLTTNVATAEPNWEVLQSGYDSVHEQVWNDNQCALCGAEINDCLPSARQEHEDFHFAMWLQQQGEESSTTTTTPPTQTATRPVVQKESKKRKVSGAKVNSSHKRASNRPIETFFNKAK